MYTISAFLIYLQCSFTVKKQKPRTIYVRTVLGFDVYKIFNYEFLKLCDRSIFAVLLFN